MTCNQKSGVFLDRSCENEAVKQCSNCEKHVCKSHFKVLDDQKLCEDCYWELFLYNKQRQVYRDDTITDNRDPFPTSSSSSYSSSDDGAEGFAGGFGGGSGGGGGASGAWTEGDMEGFNNLEDATASGMLGDDNDNTFFYS